MSDKEAELGHKLVVLAMENKLLKTRVAELEHVLEECLYNIEHRYPSKNNIDSALIQQTQAILKRKPKKTIRCSCNARPERMSNGRHGKWHSQSCPMYDGDHPEICKEPTEGEESE